MFGLIRCPGKIEHWSDIIKGDAIQSPGAFQGIYGLAGFTATTRGRI